MAEVTARTSVPSDQPVESTQLNRAVEALRTQETFTRAQVAWITHTAFRWGYELRVDEENAGWPDPTVLFNAGDTIKAINQRAYRQQCDTAGRLSRSADYRGGPVSWGDDALDLRAAA